MIDATYGRYISAMGIPVLGYSCIENTITKTDQLPEFEFMKPIEEKKILLFMYDSKHIELNRGKRRYTIGKPDTYGIRYATCVEGERWLPAIGWCNDEKTHFYFEIDDIDAEKESHMLKMHFWIDTKNGITEYRYWSNRYELVYLNITDDRIKC